MCFPEIYNTKRRIIFSTYHDKGFDIAFKYLEGYKKDLGSFGYKGLKAELNFYHNHRQEFKLVLAADVGDHTDFAGNMGGSMVRFDVTTNVELKKLSTYDPLQRKEMMFKIALIDNVNGNLIDIIDLNLPFCTFCDRGRLIDIGVLLPENFDSEGMSRWSSDQVLISVCNFCGEYTEVDRISTHNLSDFETITRNNQSIDVHCQNVVPYLNKAFERPLIALGGHSYEITNPKDGDGFYSVKVYWKKTKYKIITSQIEDIYDIDLRNTHF